MKDSRGFSIVELLIVIAVIGTIMAVAVPGLVKARQYAQSGSAIQTLRTVTSAENLYKIRHKRYALLTDLAPEGTIDEHIAAGEKSGYTFDLKIDVIDGVEHFHCTADPRVEPSTSSYFFVDDSAVIKFEVGAPATALSAPIPR
ncbi:MAG TPA: prepilin-type N-terminal cleavage/methylation domain-containing protein [Blastocatellia bacterium]|nr:prepilin-type N-terminal cleavage/methylation domain-containing protein [Blastocatellia bacterium]